VLQYADDTIFCLKNEMKIARNVKLLLYIFEQMSGLKINFDKSEVILVCVWEGGGGITTWPVLMLTYLTAKLVYSQ
jgi:hypothetical protein